MLLAPAASDEAASYTIHTDFALNVAQPPKVDVFGAKIEVTLQKQAVSANAPLPTVGASRYPTLPAHLPSLPLARSPSHPPALAPARPPSRPPSRPHPRPLSPPGTLVCV